MAAQPMPAAEIAVPLDLVRALLADQAADLAHLPLRLLANGWDNVVWRLGDELVVRLPRRGQGAHLVVHEQRWLPLLAPRLPLPVPVPLRAGRPAGGYPWSWSVVPFLPGDAAAVAPPRDPVRTATDVGAFLAALHLPAPLDAPENPVRGVPLAERHDTVAARLALLDGVVDVDAVRRTWDAALAVPAWTGPPLWLHGDLHPANILVADGDVSGVIDFGDLTAGDPATDLAVAWMLLPNQQHAVLRGSYAERAVHGLDEATWRRARGWALALSLAFLAHSADNPLGTALGTRTLAAVLSDDD